MEFLMERILKLSGIDSAEEQVETLTETAEVKPEKAPTLREVRESNRKRQETLVESQVRNVIRSEIDAIIAEMQEKDELSWMFRGMKSPKKSKSGKITKGFLGIGFANRDE